VLTAYTSIDGKDVTTFTLRPRKAGETTVVDEIVQQAAEAANNILVPEGLNPETWQKLDSIQRFYCRMLDIETTGAAKLDNYQNFAKAFGVADYSKVMANMAANAARLKTIPEFASRDLSDSTEIGKTQLGSLIVTLQQLIAEQEPKSVLEQLQRDLPELQESSGSLRPRLCELVEFIGLKSREIAVKNAAEVLAGLLRNQRALGQD